jgi:A/G-specific adenine glycosylase
MKNLLPNKILAWYDNNKRDLPWRRFKGFKDKSYKVLVSEFMLQQTQVKTVIPYFEKFIEKFTSLEKLSEANLTTVYRFWQGLGYYSRAKNLLRTSKIIQSKFNGKIPEDYNVLLTFPGIGDYTASAIMAIAFNKNFVGVDGNVERFIARLFAFSARNETYG